MADFSSGNDLLDPFDHFDDDERDDVSNVDVNTSGIVRDDVFVGVAEEGCDNGSGDGNIVRRVVVMVVAMVMMVVAMVVATVVVMVVAMVVAMVIMVVVMVVKFGSHSGYD